MPVLVPVVVPFAEPTAFGMAEPQMLGCAQPHVAYTQVYVGMTPASSLVWHPEGSAVAENVQGVVVNVVVPVQTAVCPPVSQEQTDVVIVDVPVTTLPVGVPLAPDRPGPASPWVAVLPPQPTAPASIKVREESAKSFTSRSLAGRMHGRRRARAGDRAIRAAFTGEQGAPFGSSPADARPLQTPASEIRPPPAPASADAGPPEAPRSPAMAAARTREGPR